MTSHVNIVTIVREKERERIHPTHKWLMFVCTVCALITMKCVSVFRGVVGCVRVGWNSRLVVCLH